MTPLPVSVTVALVSLALLAAAPWGMRRRRARVRRSPRQRHDPDVDEAVLLDLLRAALASGHDLTGALDAVGAALPTRQGEAYRTTARSLRLGMTWDDAWTESDAVSGALAPAWSDGVDPEPMLQHAAASIRRRRQTEARQAAARLGVRLVLPLGLCLLPAFVLLGLVPLLLSAGLDLWGS